MNVVLFGATGMVGSRILNELISRGHHVTAVARDPAKAVASPLVQALQGDVLNSTDVARLAKGADAVISAYSPGMEAPEKLNDAVKSLFRSELAFAAWPVWRAFFKKCAHALFEVIGHAGLCVGGNRGFNLGIQMMVGVVIQQTFGRLHRLRAIANQALRQFARLRHQVLFVHDARNESQLMGFFRFNQAAGEQQIARALIANLSK